MHESTNDGDYPLPGREYWHSKWVNEWMNEWMILPKSKKELIIQVNEGTLTYDEIVMNPAALIINQDQSITSTLTLQPQDKDMAT